MLRFFRDQAVEPLLGLAVLITAITGAGYGLTTRSSTTIQVVGWTLFIVGVCLASIVASAFLQLLHEHFISPRKILFQFPLRLPLRIGIPQSSHQSKSMETQIIERVVEVEPTDYGQLKSYKHRNDERSHEWITPGPERSFALVGFLIKDALKPRLILEGNFYNSSIYTLAIQKAEGYIRIEGAGTLDGPVARMMEMPSGYPNQNFRMGIIFELTHESSVTKLSQLRDSNESFVITVDGLRIFFNTPYDQDNGAPVGILRMSGDLTVPIQS